MIKVEIVDGSVDVVTMNGQRGSYQIRRQFGMVNLPNGERRKLRIRVAEGKAYAPGTYAVGDGSFTVGEYGDLQLGMLELVAVAQPAVARA